MVRGLSDGFDDEAMVAHIAKPHLVALGAAIVWPVAIATPSGATMMIRETTDHQSPLALEQYGAGVRVPMLASAAGRAYLAYCTAPQRETLLELLARSSLPEDRLVRNRVEVERILNETRTRLWHDATRPTGFRETTLAIPVCAQDRVLATISVRTPRRPYPCEPQSSSFCRRCAMLWQNRARIRRKLTGRGSRADRRGADCGSGSL